MSQNLAICNICPDLQSKLKKFRFRKETTNAAIIIKIDKSTMTMVLDEEHEDATPEEVAEELPEQQPRFVAYSYVYKHSDGRVSYPLCLIFVSPAGAKPETQMMYSGSKNHLVQKAEFSKVFELRSKDEMTTEWLESKLAFFR